MFELSNVDLFAAGEEWAKLRRPGLMEFIRQRFGKLAEALGDRPWLAGDFSVADIAMATVLREGIESGAVAEHPKLEAYLARCLARPAFDRARSEEHTSELQSLMRHSYAVICLK